RKTRPARSSGYGYGVHMYQVSRPWQGPIGPTEPQSKRLLNAKRKWDAGEYKHDWEKKANRKADREENSIPHYKPIRQPYISEKRQYPQGSE
ncbi:6964_t:CDS:2, partial [Ambispora gerdemannii]